MAQIGEPLRRRKMNPLVAPKPLKEPAKAPAKPKRKEREKVPA